jgi:hypothetical protein
MRAVSFLASLALAAGFLVGASAPAYAAPAVGECLDMPANTNPFDPLVTGTSVDCEAPHNGEVFALAEYPADWGKPSEERERLDDFGWLFATCPFAALDEYKQSAGAPGLMIPDRFFFKAGAPTDAEWEAGDRTVRCIVTALVGAPGREKMTAWTGSIPNLLGTPAGIREFARCTPGQPKSGRRNAIAACSTAKNWVAVNYAFDLTGSPGKPFPGPAIQKQADAKCVKAIRGFVKGKKVKPFAAVETKRDWDEGLRSAVCYIPFNNWNGKGSV